MTMKAERQYSKLQQADLILHKRDKSSLDIVDNRPQIAVLTQLTRSIQKQQEACPVIQQKKGLNINNDNFPKKEVYTKRNIDMDDKSFSIQRRISTNKVFQFAREGSVKKGFSKGYKQWFKTWILQVKDFVFSDRFAEAYNCIANFEQESEKVAKGKKSVTLKIKSKEIPNSGQSDLIQIASMYTALTNFYYENDLKIEIALPPMKFDYQKGLEIDGDDSKNDNEKNLALIETFHQYWFQYPLLAKQILLMALEEFMHAYQDINNKFLSSTTSDFKDAPYENEVDDDEYEDYTKSDYDEIDIAAALMDWGFDVEQLGVLNRHSDVRNPYKEWRES